MRFLSPRPLEQADRVADFDCGKEALNAFIERYAFQSQQSQSARTYVIFTEAGKLAGYYSLTFGSVEYGEAPVRARKGMPKYPIPVMILARLAVDREFQGRRLGEGLLRDALLRTLNAAEIAGLRAVLVHAKDEEAKRFYAKYEFEPFPGDDLKLCLLMKDLRALLG